jgi:hypothetical protein
MYLKCHYSTGGAEAVEGKHRFEQFANLQGIKVKAYRADNGIMAKREYMASIELNQQTISLSGVNHHSQNGIAERNIRTVSDRARTMLLHAIEKWPDAITLDLWPFALKMAVDIHNATPGQSGLSPEEIFTRQKARQDRLVDFHTFGCLVFVLDPKLQQGHKLPKWQPRSRQAIYLGHSPRHAQTVPIVLQYHVVFDDTFSTTTASTTNTLPETWSELFSHSRLDCFEGEGDNTVRPSLASEWDETGDTDSAIQPSDNTQTIEDPTINMPEGGLEPVPQGEAQITPATLPQAPEESRLLVPEGARGDLETTVGVTSSLGGHRTGTSYQPASSSTYWLERGAWPLH